MKREIIAFKNYYLDFMKKLAEEERRKILRALMLFQTEDKIPYHYIKHLEDGIYEFRVTHKNIEYRLLFIYDGDKIVVLFNCFKKKTQKTPKTEIDKAKRLRKEYFDEKE